MHNAEEQPRVFSSIWTNQGPRVLRLVFVDSNIKILEQTDSIVFCNRSKSLT